MSKIVLSAVLVLLFAVSWSFSEDDVWKNRNSAEGAKAAYEFYKQALATKGDFESAWKLARAVDLYAGNFISDNDTKKAVYTEGKKAAEKARTLDPTKPEGWYWYGVCLGNWASANGILDSLGSAGPLTEACRKAIQLDPEFDHGSVYVLRGRVYHLAPAVISVGDKNKAEADYKKALELNPSNRTACLFYSELLIDNGQKDKARDMIARGIAIPLDEANSVSDGSDLKKLKALQEKVK
jgi:tetratricopeptide (TPR) repeat protein